MDLRPRKRQKKLVHTGSGYDDNSTHVLDIQGKVSEKQKGRNAVAQNARASQKKVPRAESQPSPLTQHAAASSLDSNPQATDNAETLEPIAGKQHPSKESSTTSRSRPISSFFASSTATEWRKSLPQRTRNVQNDTAEHEIPKQDLADVIEDEFPEETGRPFRHVTVAAAGPSNSSRTKLNNGGQKFQLSAPVDGSTYPHNAKLSSKTDAMPWSECFQPYSADDLAVHKRKISDVKDWLESSLSCASSKGILVLKGPSGAGKSAVVRTVARSMNVGVIEWRNPIESDFSSEAYVTMSSRLEDFLSRGGRYSGLEMAGEGDSPPPKSSTETETGTSLQRNIILMEEFPTSLSPMSLASQSFRNALLEYLAHRASRPGHHASAAHNGTLSVSPLVLVLTESSNTAPDGENFTARRLLGTEILAHGQVSVIEFNPVAKSFILRALHRTLYLHAQGSGRRHNIPAELLKAISEVGDIRSAINSVEFLCHAGSKVGSIGSAKSKSVAGSGNSTNEVTGKPDFLESFLYRTSTLSWFHAVGKVVWNKRDRREIADPSTQSACQTSEGSPSIDGNTQQFSIDDLIDEAGIDAKTFIAALHENFVLSCNGLNFLDSLNGCLDAIGDSDILDSQRHGMSWSQGGIANRIATSSGAEFATHGAIASQVAIRGMLFSLPHSVQRKLPGNMRSNAIDPFKMYYPRSVRVLRLIKENESLIRDMAKPPQTLGFQSQSTTLPHSEPQPSRRSEEQETLAEDHASCGSCLHTISELLLERLPYAEKIGMIKSDRHAGQRRNLVQFCSRNSQDFGLQDAESLVNDGGMFEPKIAERHQAQEAPQKKASFTPREEGLKDVVLTESASAYLQVDDIEDD